MVSRLPGRTHSSDEGFRESHETCGRLLTTTVRGTGSQRPLAACESRNSSVTSTSRTAEVEALVGSGARRARRPSAYLITFRSTHRGRTRGRSAGQLFGQVAAESGTAAVTKDHCSLSAPGGGVLCFHRSPGGNEDVQVRGRRRRFFAPGGQGRAGHSGRGAGGAPSMGVRLVRDNQRHRFRARRSRSRSRTQYSVSSQHGILNLADVHGASTSPG